MCVCVPCAAIVRAEVWSRKFPFWDDEQLEVIRVLGGAMDARFIRAFFCFRRGL